MRPLLPLWPAPVPVRPLSLFLLSLGAAAQTQAQTPPTAAPAASAPARVQQVEIQAVRPDDTEERRRSTASKIIVGRDEIERYGDATLGELLKRLPGVTLDGRAGRGGNVRMRGLGGGYTQILLDGERVQGGLSLDQLDPEQVERIEIIRAPTAETGARAIAGTINVITREGFRKRLNDVKLAAGAEHGQGGGNLSWTRDDKFDDTLSYNFSVSTWSYRRHDAGVTDTSSATEDLHEASESASHRTGVWSNGRLQWRLGGGDSFMLMPSAMASRGGSEGRSVLDVRRDDDGQAPAYASSATPAESDYAMGRLNFMWRQGLTSGGRLEWRGGIGGSRSSNHSQRLERDAAGQRLRELVDDSRGSERNAHLNTKFSQLLEGDHQLVAGTEIDLARRSDSRDTLQDGVPLLAAFGTDVQARTRRLAAYAQDEWSVNPNWSAHAGLRWEGIATQGEDASGVTPENRSSVWTPLLHAVWKPDPKGRDQLRISLTRSYRSPQLGQLVGLPSLSSRYPVPGSNTPTSPDRAGNPALRPELATGVDIALERYLSGGGLLSANLFHRRINDLMRTLTTLETVPWSDVPRWVARPQNLGRASTTGLELEVRSRLAELWPEAPQVDLHANASAFVSRVDSVPGPHNRLDQQPSGTLNMGADWKIAGTPFTLGGNLNWTPGYSTRLSDTQWLVQGRKQSLDSYLLWQINPWARLRLSASNLAAEDALATSLNAGETARSANQTYLNLRAQLELKL